MNSKLHRALASALVVACALCFASTARAQAPKVLKISHQFPASTGDDGDFRDQLARKFAAEVEKRTNGQLKIEVYPNGSLVKTFSQFGAIRKGTLDMSVLPLAYGGGEVPGDEPRPDAGAGDELRPGPALEDGADRQGVREDPRRQGHQDPDVGVAGGRHRQQDRRRSCRPTTPRA